MCFYKKAGFELAFVYRAGKAVILLVTHSARDILNNPPPLSETEIETLLTANSGGSTWKKDGFGGIMNKSWITEDGLTMAMYDPFKNTLSIMTTEEFQRKVQDGKSEEKKSLEGF